MSTLWSKLKTNHTLKHLYIVLLPYTVLLRYIVLRRGGLLRLSALVCGLLLVSLSVHGQDMVWPQFRGPESNPVGMHARLAERWSKTENVEWSQEIPGRGWSSPIVTGGRVYVTTVTTEGKSKPPQIGTEYSNEYVAELMKQGVPMEQVLKRVTEQTGLTVREETRHVRVLTVERKK